MTSIMHNVSFDCADPYELAGFWAEALGRSRHPEDQPGDPETALMAPDGVGPNVFFQRVPEASPGVPRTGGWLVGAARCRG